MSGIEEIISIYLYIVDINNDIRVAIFEDNLIMQDAFYTILNGSDGFICTGSYTNCNNITNNLLECAPHVILMDIELAGINGIAATRIVKQQFPHIKILIQTVFEDESKILEAICAGANGYILKNIPVEKLLEAIKDVTNGGVAFTPSVAHKVVQLFQQHVPHSHPTNSYQLTEREKEILYLLTEGLPMPKIAEKIFVSYHTVRDHVKNIYQKLHVASATEAVAKALKEKLV